MNEAEIIEDRTLAKVLIYTWALRTGRLLRNAPPGQLTEQELIDFWADDLMTLPYPV